MPFIRNIKTDQTVVSLFSGEISLEYGETARISAARLAAGEVQSAISSGDIKEVSSLNFVESFIKGQWDMGASTALPPGAQPGYVYEVTTAAVHPSSGDGFNAGDLASIGTDGILVRNLTATLNSGGGGVGQYTWVEVSSNYTASNNEYILADSTLASFNIILPTTPDLGTTVGIYPSTESFTVNAVTVLRNGELIQGLSDDLLLDENLGVTLIYAGGTIGWLVLPIDDTVVFIQDLQADSFYTIKDVGGTSYTLLPSDSGKILVFDTASAVNITLPEQATNVLPRGYYVSFRNKQGGAITLNTEGTDVLTGAGSVTNDSTKMNSVYLEESASPNTWVSVGDLT